MIVFHLHFQGHFAFEICAIARSLMEFFQAEVRHILFLLPQVSNATSNVDTSHHKLILKTSVWFIFEILEHTTMLV